MRVLLCCIIIALEQLNLDPHIFPNSFGPVFPKPKDCNVYPKDVDGRFNLTCCYKGSHNASYFNQNCHYSTILPLVEALQQAEDGTYEIPITTDDVESESPRRQNADYCEQSGAFGFFGKPFRWCTPGGKGCFHVNGLEDPNEAVIASCIGRDERLNVTSKDAFDRYHGALICLTEEAKGQCHAVCDGIRWRKVCCCEVDYVAQRIGEFKDDDDKE